LLLLLIAIISSSSILYSLKNLKLCIPSKKTYHEVFPFLIISSFEQLISVIPIIIAGAIGTGAISYLSYANKLNLLISSVALLLISTLIFPALTKHIVASSFVKMEAYCKKVFKLITLLTLGLAIPIFLWSESIVTLIYLRGEFLPRDVKVVTLLLQILIISLPFIVLKDYLIRLCISLDLKKYILRGMLFNILILVLGGLALANNIYYTALLVIVSSLLTTIYFILLVFFNKKISFFIELKYGLFLFIILMITGICIKLLSVAYFERYSIFLGGSLYLIVFGCLLFKNSHLIKSVLLSKLD
jgi:putative peptidoglycan lipid II flippase